MTSTLFLRRALLADAVISGATGALMLFGAGVLGGLLGLPTGFLRLAGASLIPFAALVAYLGTREHPSVPAAWAVIACNAVWAIDSVLIVALGWVAPNGLGVAFIFAQALAVAGFAGLQYVGLRRVTATA